MKTAAINMRLKPFQQEILTKAASVLGMDRSTFILNAACRQAEDVLSDQRFFYVNEITFDEFSELLTQSPTEAQQENLNQLMQHSSAWEK